MLAYSYHPHTVYEIEEVFGMGTKKIQLVEEAFGASIEIVLSRLAGEGLNKETAATRLGITKKTLLSWLDRYGVEWPVYTKEHSTNRLSTLRESTMYTVVLNGEEMPLFEAAKRSGISYKVALERFKKGDRGARLFRSVRQYRPRKKKYSIELSAEDWKLACDLAQAIGTRKAARKLDIPMGALSNFINEGKHA